MADAKDAKDIRKKQNEAVLQSLMGGVAIKKACDEAGIDVTTFWRRRKKSKSLGKKVLAIIESRIQLVEDALYIKAIKGNVIAQIFYLKNRDPDRWKDQQYIKGQIGGKIEHEHTQKYQEVKQTFDLHDPELARDFFKIVEKLDKTPQD